jgi:hypothetical protein
MSSDTDRLDVPVLSWHREVQSVLGRIALEVLPDLGSGIAEIESEAAPARFVE